MTDVPPLVLKGIDEVTVLCGVACARWVALGGATAGDARACGPRGDSLPQRTRASVEPKGQIANNPELHPRHSASRPHTCLVKRPLSCARKGHFMIAVSTRPVVVKGATYSPHETAQKYRTPKKPAESAPAPPAPCTHIVVCARCPSTIVHAVHGHGHATTQGHTPLAALARPADRDMHPARTMAHRGYTRLPRAHILEALLALTPFRCPPAMSPLTQRTACALAQVAGRACGPSSAARGPPKNHARRRARHRQSVGVVSVCVYAYLVLASE